MNARQIQALRANEITAKDILENDNLFEELVKDFDELDVEEASTLPNSLPKKLPKKLQPRPTGPMRVDRSRERVKTPDEELEEMNQEAAKVLADRQRESEAQQSEKPQEAPEDLMRQQILGALKGLPKGPTEADINRWKQEFGENAIYVTAFTEHDVYVYTYLRRKKWQQIKTAMANVAKTNPNVDIEEETRYKVLQYTILWPRPLSLEFLYEARGGILDSLFEVIMANSAFLPVQQAMMLTTQL